MTIGNNQATRQVLKWVKTPLAYFLRNDIALLEEAARAHGVRAGRQQGHGQGHKVGYAEGMAVGTEQGDREGYARGFAEGQTIYRIVDERSAFKPQPLDDSLYGPKPFAITDTMKRRMKAEVLAAADDEIVGKPTTEQWDMIFTDHPATCVSAGAGSGKSTTLVLRVIFMVQHMGIPLDQITVVSFTRDSCKELRHKLAKVLGYWQGRVIDESDLQQTVRTFHSLLMRVVRRSFPKMAIFEHADEKNLLRGEESDELADNPVATSQLNDEQLELLHDAYRTAYNASAAFRGHIHELFKLEFDLRRSVPADKTRTYQEKSYEYSSRRDPLIIREMHAIWEPLGLSDSPVEIGPTLAFRYKGHPFYADGRLGPDGPFVLLDLPKGDWRQVIATPGTVDVAPLPQVLATRHRIFSAHCEAAVILIRAPQDLEQLAMLMRIRSEQTLSEVTKCLGGGSARPQSKKCGAPPLAG